MDNYEARIIVWMIKYKIADNRWQAAHIANNLHLSDLPDDIQRLKRAALYRDWRRAGEKKPVCVENAINGIKPPLSLFEGVLYSDTIDFDQLKKEKNIHNG